MKFNEKFYFEPACGTKFLLCAQDTGMVDFTENPNACPLVGTPRILSTWHMKESMANLDSVINESNIVQNSLDLIN